MEIYPHSFVFCKDGCKGHIVDSAEIYPEFFKTSRTCVCESVCEKQTVFITGETCVNIKSNFKPPLCKDSNKGMFDITTFFKKDCKGHKIREKMLNVPTLHCDSEIDIDDVKKVKKVVVKKEIECCRKNANCKNIQCECNVCFKKLCNFHLESHSHLSTPKIQCYYAGWDCNKVQEICRMCRYSFCGYHNSRHNHAKLVKPTVYAGCQYSANGHLLYDGRGANF